MSFNFPELAYIFKVSAAAQTISESYIKWAANIFLRRMLFEFISIMLNTALYLLTREAFPSTMIMSLRTGLKPTTQNTIKERVNRK